MASKTDRKFRIRASIGVAASVTISAASFEEALEKSKALKVDDFIAVVDEFDDYDMKIASIERDGAWVPEVK